jgi:hypothetical protein
VPVAAVLLPGWKTRAVGAAPAAVVISAVWPPAKVTTPAVEIFRFDPITWKVPVVLPIVVVAPAPDDKVVVPVEVKVVKAPVDGVEAPMAVELMPVEVVVKCPEVKLISFDPASIDEAERLLKVNVPDEAVRFKAPPVRVNPLVAVRSSDEVKAPLFKVVTPDRPIFRADALVVPILIIPLELAPAPASRVTLPPVLVPDPLVASPPSRLKDPPVEVVPPD